MHSLGTGISCFPATSSWNAILKNCSNPDFSRQRAGPVAAGAAGECCDTGERAECGSGGCGVETAGGGGELIMGIEKKAGCDGRSKHWSSVCGRDSGEPAAVRRSDSASEHVSVESDGQHQQPPFPTGVRGNCCRRILPMPFRPAVPVDPARILFCE